MNGTSAAAIVAATATAAQAAAGNSTATVAAAREMVGMPKAEYDANLSASNASGRKDGAAAERARIKAIMSAPEAKGRESLANHIAFDTDLPAEQGIGMLKAAPEAAKASRLDGQVPTPHVESADSSGGAPTASQGLAAATQRLIEKMNAKAGR